MTYNPNTPQPFEIPSESQSRFLDNFLLFNQYFSQDHVQLGNVISNATLAAPCVITSVAHGLATGNTVTVYDITGLLGNTPTPWSINGSSFTITVIDANTFSLDGSNTTLEPTYLAGTGNFSSASYAYGYHKQLSMPSPLLGDPSLPAPQASLYNKIFRSEAGTQPSTKADLFFQNSEMISQLTRLFMKTKTTAAGIQRFIDTPWDISIKFGYLKTIDSLTTTVNFAEPFSTVVYGAIISPIFKDPGDYITYVVSLSLTQAVFISYNSAIPAINASPLQNYYIVIGK